MFLQNLTLFSAFVSFSAVTVAAFDLPDLPYAYDALEPYISEKTLRTHHLKHHAKYVTTTNSMVSGDPSLKDFNLREIIETDEIRENNIPIFNNAAQSWNHAFYWKCMAPPSENAGKDDDIGGGGLPDPDTTLAKMIDRDFGSFDKFREEMEAAALSAFGSGWAWLCYDSEGQKLVVRKTIGAGNPLTEGLTPILTIDVWEHAYYLDYQEKRASYVKTFFDKLVNWKAVQLHLKAEIIMRGMLHSSNDGDGKGSWADKIKNKLEEREKPSTEEL